MQILFYTSILRAFSDRQSDFFERPSNTEVLYIPFVTGNNVSFAAVQLVEFLGSTGKNLAGLYVIYGGDQLGQMTLYQANSTIVGGICTSTGTHVPRLTAFNNDYATRQALTLTQATAGNILLYPVNGHLYYFIPAYIHQSQGVVERNPFVDVIDAQNSSAPVRLIPTNSSLITTYGFNMGRIFTNSTLRAQYIDSLFTAHSIPLANSTVTNVNIVDNLGTTTYQVDSENTSATNFVNNFIKGYATNSTVTGERSPSEACFTGCPPRGRSTLDLSLRTRA